MFDFDFFNNLTLKWCDLVFLKLFIAFSKVNINKDSRHKYREVLVLDYAGVLIM